MRGDLEWRSIPNLARWAAARYGDAEGVVDGATRITFEDLWARSAAAARAFIAAGVEPGDRVAIWAPNRWEWVVALLGLQSAGAVLVPLNTRSKGAEAAYILNASRAKVLVTVDGFLGSSYLEMLRAEELPHLERTVVLPDSWDDFVATGASVEPSEVDACVDALTPDALADMMFTSGTTGRPKGVLTTHGQTLRAFQSWASVTGLRAGDRYLLVNPMFHTFGYKAGIVAALLAGATLVALPVFDVDDALAAIARERISMIPGPPTLYQSLLNHPKLGDADLSTLRLAVTGAAAIPVDLVRRMRDELGFETVITGYGLTEVTGVATMCRYDDDLETIACTSGRAIPDVEVRVVDDDDGREVPRGDAGEIVVRGYNVMQGYFEDPEQTAETIDVDGWLHTGDIGVMDDRGYVRITDRKKDMFIVGGFNAYPAEIESLLLAHPQIAQAAVVGVPDERLGEVGVAFVVPVHGAVLDADEVVAWARSTMANFKAPRRVEVVDALPLNASGKVMKFELRAIAQGQGHP